MNQPFVPLVLVVDDHRNTARVVAAILRGDGCRVETAGSVREALAMISRFRDQIRLLITDWRLKDGCGAEIIRAAREAGIRRVIVMSADLPHAEHDIRGTQADYLLPKPYDMADLRGAASSFLLT